MLFEKIALVGVGLLGGSLALAARDGKLARSFTGYVRRAGSIAECEQVGLRDFATRDLIAAVRNADLVVLCTPLAQMRALTERMLPALQRGAIVTDVGSVKGSVVTELEPMVAAAGALFVGAHPMAGAEKMGVAAARADLFRNAVCVLTPTRQTNREALGKVQEFWRALGARVLKLTPDLHDTLVARCSHLPHIVAAEIAHYVLSPSLPKEQPTLCANGFRDTTRIASGSPEMWRDIVLANRDNIAAVLDVFISDLQKLRRAISAADTRKVEEFFGTAKERRDAWCAGSASPSME